MSMFYGQVSGCAETTASRRGGKNSGIKSSVQSWDGSVIMKMYDDNGITKVRIQISDDSDFYGEEFFDGTLDELKIILKGGANDNT